MRIFKRSGYTLVEMLVAVGIGSLLAVGITSLIVFMFNSQNQKQIIATLTEKSNEIKNMMSTKQAVLNTINASLLDPSKNPNLSCLQSQVSCTDPVSCATATQCDSVYQNNFYAPTNDRIIFYRNEKGSTPTVFLDGRAGSTQGFTDKGTACNTFSENMAAGNDACPIGYLVNWYILTTGTTSGNTIVFTAKLIYNPSDTHPMKKLINSTATIPSKYDVSVSTKMESIVNLTTRKCYQGGVYVYEGSSKLFYPVGSATTGQHCPAPESRTCREIDGTHNLTLTGSGSYSTCVENCYGTWSPCPYPCGGVSTYTRLIDGNEYGDRSCPNTGDTQNCPVCAPVNCTGSWSPCSGSCGVPGTETFTVTSPARFGGTCPALNGDTRGCWPPPCSVPVKDCAGTWSACSAACGPGTKTFSVTQFPSGGGAACPSSPAACNEAVCPTNCVGSWGAWGACSAACGGGFQTRTYTITTPAEAGGTMCPFLNGQADIQACNTTPCDPATTNLPSGVLYCGGTYVASRNPIPYPGGPLGAPSCGGLGCDFGQQISFDPATGIKTVVTNSSCSTTSIVKTKWVWNPATATWDFVSNISSSGGVPRTCQAPC